MIEQKTINRKNIRDLPLSKNPFAFGHKNNTPAKRGIILSLFIELLDHYSWPINDNACSTQQWIWRLPRPDIYRQYHRLTQYPPAVCRSHYQVQ